MKKVTLSLVCAACLLASVTWADDVYPLWNPSVPIPTTAAIEPIEDVAFRVIKQREPDHDGYNWLHGVALAWHKGVLFASFGHNRGQENTASEEARYCTSSDGGSTWSDVRAIDIGDETDLAVSHGILLSENEQLWAFHGAFYGRLERVHTRAYLFDERTGQWQKEGVVAESGFWPMQAPHRMANGDWIMAGISVGGPIGGPLNPAAVAISPAGDLTRWKVVVVPKPADMKMWGESAVIVGGPRVINIARYGALARALVGVSEDYGRSWVASRLSNLSMAGSKPYAGTLSTGHHFLICTTTADAGHRRSPLTIALSPPGKVEFDRVLRIRDARFDGHGESHERAALSYPYAVEHDGQLFIAYSNDGGRGRNRNSAELAVVAVERLVGI